MKRRELIAFLAGAAIWPQTIYGQQLSAPVIGFLRLTSPGDSTNLLVAFREGMKEAGYIEGQNLNIEYRWAEDKMDRLPELAAELVRRKVSLIVAAGNASAHVLKVTTDSIPIDFVVGEDPLRPALSPASAGPAAMLQELPL